MLCVASDERQARIVFNAARRMVELDEPQLDERARSSRTVCTCRTPTRGCTRCRLEMAALQGYDPSLAVIDELHVVTA